jgi:excisionase family DNA binding protein
MLDRLTMTIEEAAAVLGLSRCSAYAAAQAGTLPGAFKINGRRLVSRPALEKFLAEGGVVNPNNDDSRANR